MKPPKPKPRPDKVSLWRYMQMFRRDILSAQPERLYRAKMAEFRTPFFRSYLINQPDLIREVLKERPMDFPKSTRVGEGLRPLLGNSVFLTNGETWQRQRRIIDPAFEGGRLRDVFPAMRAAGLDMVTRMQGQTAEQEIEELTSHAAADVIFRTLFTIPITDEIAGQVSEEFRKYQRSQPILNLAAFIPMPKWLPRFHKSGVRKSAQIIRGLITELTKRRMAEIENDTAPDDLATKIMTQKDPQTGQCFAVDEMVDQVAIFFLAGHETSASALAWALYLLALHPEAQAKVASEVASLPDVPVFSDLSKLKYTRDVFREALRLYPPVPMVVRETTRPEVFRKRALKTGAQIVISPWHLHRHENQWPKPDEFDPGRFSSEVGKKCLRNAYLPFSSGARVCPGAGFAMIEGPLFLALLVRAFKFSTVSGKIPVPEAHLTVRARHGIWLRIEARG